MPDVGIHCSIWSLWMNNQQSIPITFSVPLDEGKWSPPVKDSNVRTFQMPREMTPNSLELASLQCSNI